MGSRLTNTRARVRPANIIRLQRLDKTPTDYRAQAQRPLEHGARLKESVEPSPTQSASRRKVLSRLNTRPARTLVNASTPSFRTAPT